MSSNGFRFVVGEAIHNIPKSGQGDIEDYLGRGEHTTVIIESPSDVIWVLGNDEDDWWDLYSRMKKGRGDDYVAYHLDVVREPVKWFELTERSSDKMLLRTREFIDAQDVSHGVRRELRYLNYQGSGGRLLGGKEFSQDEIYCFSIYRWPGPRMEDCPGPTDEEIRNISEATSILFDGAAVQTHVADNKYSMSLPRWVLYVTIIGKNTRECS